MIHFLEVRDKAGGEVFTEGVGQAHVHSASDDVMLSEIVRFCALQPLSNAFCVVFESSLPW